MKPAAVRTVHRVDFRNKLAPQRDSTPQGRVPRVTRMLALAHKIDGMIHVGELRDLVDAARAVGVTRARMTQIMNLLLLPPAIQEAILALPPSTSGRDPVTERSLRPIVAEADWDEQRALGSEVRRCPG